MRCLGRLADIGDGESRGYPAAPGGFTGLFAVRRGGQAWVYVNCCPHVGVALDRERDRFLTGDGALILCSAHGARFEVETGLCVAGPCEGRRLEAVAATVVAGDILVPDGAGL